MSSVLSLTLRVVNVECVVDEPEGMFMSCEYAIIAIYCNTELLANLHY